MPTLTPASSPVSSPELSIPSVGRSQILHGLRVGWLALAICLFAVFLVSIPGTYRMLQTPCPPSGTACATIWQATPARLAQLNQVGISLQTIALYIVVLYTVVSLVFWAVGLLVFWHRSENWFALLTAHLMVLLGMGGPSLIFHSGLYFSSLPTVITNILGLLVVPVYQFISLFLILFPNGKFFGRWNWLPFVLICLNTFFWATGSPTLNILTWPPALTGIWLLIVYGSHLVVQVIRYRSMYTPIERQQTKWLVYAFGMGIMVMFLPGTIFPNFTENPLVSVARLPLLYLPLGLAVGVAILRYRLWDIDVIIRRTLVYGCLTAVVVGIYVLVVGTLSALFQNSGNLFISLIATGLVALLFQPLRERFQRLVDKYVYGERNNPYAVISRLSERLETIAAPGTLLPGIAEMIAQALKLPYVAIVVKVADEFRTDAVYGQPTDQGHIMTLPLMYNQEIIGRMVIGQAVGDKALDKDERQLLDNIARQTGIATHAVQLSIALQQSRQHIITAREEERRRLRRDLHDGLGPALAAHTIKIGVARALIESSPQMAFDILTELETGLANSLIDIRRLVYNLRPPALDQFGLVGALRDFIQQCNGTTMFTLETPNQLPTLSAAIEVAAYRIVQEAVNNVIRHAHARHCVIKLQVNGRLVVTVSDDGIGLPSRVKYGVGLNSIRERSEELGGQFTIHDQSGGGTQMQVLLSFPADQTETDADFNGKSV